MTFIRTVSSFVGPSDDDDDDDDDDNDVRIQCVIQGARGEPGINGVDGRHGQPGLPGPQVFSSHSIFF